MRWRWRGIGLEWVSRRFAPDRPAADADGIASVDAHGGPRWHSRGATRYAARGSSRTIGITRGWARSR